MNTKQRMFIGTLPLLLGLAVMTHSCGSDVNPGPESGAQAGIVPSATPSPGAPSPSPSASATVITFTQIYQKILQPNCVSCHSGANPRAGVDLSNYAGALAQVVPGNPGQSRLYQAVSSGAMPPSGALPQDQIQQLGDWITAGAKND